MNLKRLKYWIIGLVVTVSVFTLRRSSLMGFNFKGFDIGTQKLMLLLGYIVVIPTIILILSYEQKEKK